MNSDSIAEAPTPELDVATDATAQPNRLSYLLADLRRAGGAGQAQWLRWIEAFRRSEAPV